MSRLARRALLASALLAALGLFATPPAHGAVGLHGLVSPQPVSWTPNITAGARRKVVCERWFGGNCSNTNVFGTATVNGEVVVVGAFTRVCQAESGPRHCVKGTSVLRDDIFAYTPGTGRIDPYFRPRFNRGPVYAVVPGPNDTVYVAGNFTTVDGHPGHRGVVQLKVTPGNSAADGTIVGRFTGYVNSSVRTLAYNARDGDALYIGGNFSKADGAPEQGDARLNATTGRVDSSWHIRIGDPADSLPLKVQTMALTNAGKVLAIAGSFLKVNGYPRPRLALVDTGGGYGKKARLGDWAAPILANPCSPQHDYIRGLDFSPGGYFLVIADTGYRPSPFRSAGVCDAAARFPAAQRGTKVKPDWINYTGGDSIYSVQVTGTIVYVGGHNRWVNNECGNNQVCERNSVLTQGLSAIDARTGLALPWFHPMTLRGHGTKSLTAFPAGKYPARYAGGGTGGLIIGNDVGTDAGAHHGLNALFPLPGSQSSSTFGSIPSGLFLRGRLGGYDEHTIGIAARCMADPGDSTTPNSVVVMNPCSNDGSQNWLVEPGGHIKLANDQIGSNMCLDSAGDSTATGTRVVVDRCASVPTQVWSSGAGHTLVNKAAHLCVTDPDSRTARGTVLVLQSCPRGTPPARKVWPLPAAPKPSSLVPSGPLYPSKLQSSTQPACATGTGYSPGASVIMRTCIGGKRMTASVEPNGSIEINNLCLDTAGGARTAGTEVVLATCDGAATQTWVPASGHTLVNKGADLCLNALSTSNGGGLDIASCSSPSRYERWWLPAM